MNSAGRPRARRSWLTMIVAAVADRRRVSALGMWRPWSAVSPPDAGGTGPRKPSPRPRFSRSPKHRACWSSATRGCTARRPPCRPRLRVCAERPTRLGRRDRRRARQRVSEAGHRRRIVRRAHRGTRSGARPRPRDPRGIDQRPPAVSGRISGCRHRRVGCTRGPLPRRTDRDPRPRAAGAPGGTPTARIDEVLRELAAARGWWYISPIAEEWITEANYLDVIDTGEIGRNHPSTRRSRLSRRPARLRRSRRFATTRPSSPRHRRPRTRSRPEAGRARSRVITSSGAPP